MKKIIFALTAAFVFALSATGFCAEPTKHVVFDVLSPAVGSGAVAVSELRSLDRAMKRVRTFGGDVYVSDFRDAGDAYEFSLVFPSAGTKPVNVRVSENSGLCAIIGDAKIVISVKDLCSLK